MRVRGVRLTAVFFVVCEIERKRGRLTLHTEESFKKKLKKTLSNFAVRKGWRYIGVWERSPEKKRLHFHGMLYVPEDTIPGGFEIRDSYSFSNKRRQKTKESTYFLDRFGRNDFEDLNTERALAAR